MTTRELIESAFADVSYPGDDNIADHQDCLECEELRSFFRGKTWRGLKLDDLRGMSLTLLTPEARCYFLPGYMLAAMADWKQADMIPYGVIGIGGYCDGAPDVKDRNRKMRKIFNAQQRHAIATWLRDLSKSGPPELRGDDDIEFAIKQILED